MLSERSLTSFVGWLGIGFIMATAGPVLAQVSIGSDGSVRVPGVTVGGDGMVNVDTTHVENGTHTVTTPSISVRHGSGSADVAIARKRATERPYGSGGGDAYGRPSTRDHGRGE